MRVSKACQLNVNKDARWINRWLAKLTYVIVVFRAKKKLANNSTDDVNVLNKVLILLSCHMKVLNIF